MNDLESKLKQSIKDKGLSKFMDQILSIKKEAVNLLPDRNSPSGGTIGKSKLGGCPSVPKDFNWPKDESGPLSFIAQIELNQLPKIAEFHTNKDILLSFFYNNYSWGFRSEDANSFKVFSFDKSQALEEQSPPKLAPKKAFFGFLKSEQKVRVYKECCLFTEKSFSLPVEFELSDFSDENWDNYFDLIEGLEGNHRMFGFPGQIQAEVNVECEFVARGFEGIKEVDSSLNQEIEEAAKRWQLLLQIDSDTENSDMMWGDGGRLYFMIDKDDLINGNFQNCWLISQCH